MVINANEREKDNKLNCVGVYIAYIHIYCNDVRQSGTTIFRVILGYDIMTILTSPSIFLFCLL